MPNWVYIKMYVDSKDSWESIKERCVVEDRFDFNTIIPMPDEIVETESSSWADRCITYYLYATDKETPQELKERFQYDADFYKSNYSDAELSTMYNEGERYVEIYNCYGYLNWYDWSIDNWGCKWNARDLRLIEDYEKDEFSFEFYTPWNLPLPIFEELSRIYDETSFTIECEEEAGFFEGTIQYFGGKVVWQNIQ